MSESEEEKGSNQPEEPQTNSRQIIVDPNSTNMENHYTSISEALAK